jgi:ComF family protein
VRADVIARAANLVIQFLFAPACDGCGRPLEHPLAGSVCAACWRSIAVITPPWCVRCGDALPGASAGPLCVRCRRRPPAFTLARSAGRYDGALRELLHAFKYQGHRALAVPLGRRLRDAGADLLSGADAVVPVPLHPWRHWRRGFNQADDLARQLGLPVWHALSRTRHGPPQASLPAAQRHRNVRAAFRARRQLRAPPRVVVLVDDVMTTGATLEACSRALLRSGVRTVRALTLARAATARPRAQPTPLPSSTAPRR